MNAIAALQQQIERQARPETKAWWESYLKHAIPFRGVPMAGIRAELHAWLRDQALYDAAPSRQMDLALGLMCERYAEDKLAGILLLQEVLLPAGDIRWRMVLTRC
ncbi:MAG TPA: DNA alkylation repair protein [Herpetosiphonaceae bacterium]|nr:DNA alkylation repair protein [Herpetosiphonaceae bacterium]